MHRWGTFVLCLGLVGCSDDDGMTLDAGPVADAMLDAPMLDAPLDAPASALPEGLFEVVEVRSFEDESGSLELTLRRDGSPMSVRGRIELVATGEMTRDMHIVIAALSDGLLDADDPVTVETLGLTFDDPTRAVVQVDTDRFQVFEVSTEGGQLSLIRDPDDPRDTLPIDDGPSAIVLRPIARPSIVGDYQLLEYTDAETAEVVDTTSCFVEETGSSSFDMVFGVDERGALTITETRTTYSDDACMTSTDTEIGGPIGLAEEEAGVWRMWMVIPGDAPSAMHLEFSFEGDETLTLTRTACLPSPDCDDDGPSAAVIRAL